MKMENDIKSDKDGTVSTVKVNTGDAVLEGAVLVEIGA
jgi:biotin carboxyl carrier protein